MQLLRKFVEMTGFIMRLSTEALFQITAAGIAGRQLFSTTFLRGLVLGWTLLLPAASVQAAGNVNVTLTPAGDVVIVGDAADNSIDMRAVDDGTLQFTSFDTSINGGAVGVPLDLIHGALRDLRISMRAGNDSVSVFTSDAVETFRDLRFRGGQGNELFTLDDVHFSRHVVISLGGGIVGADTYGAGVDQGFGISSRVDIGGNLTIRGSATNDRIVLDGLPPDENEVGGRTRVSTGRGNDEIAFGGTHFMDPVKVQAGSGNDVVQVKNSLFNDPVLFNGAAGTDNFIDDGTNTLLFPPTIKNFELNEEPIPGGGV